MPCLLELPEIALLAIISKSDVRSICVLRKVCRDLRNFIDDTRLNLRLNVNIEVHLNLINLLISSSDIRETERIQYQKEEDGCLVVSKILKPPPIPNDFKIVPPKLPVLSGRIPLYPSPPSTKPSSSDKTVLLKEMDFIDVFSQDFKSFINSDVDKLSISLKYTSPGWDQPMDLVVDRFLENFGSDPIKTKSLMIIALRANHILKVFTFIHPQVIYVMNVRPHSKTRLNMEEIVKSEYWKKIERFYCTSFFVSGTDVRNFSHIIEGAILLENLNCKDILTVKEAFFKSSRLKIFKIEFENFDDKSELTAVLRQPATDGEWNFVIPGSSETLFIAMNSQHHTLIFTRKL